MKQTFTFLTFIFASLVAFSQAPNAMSYQAVIRDANNNLVTNHSVSMQISILQGSANGSSVYTETQKASTNDNGLVSIAIGEGTTNDNFSNIDWAKGPYFIKTETDPTGGKKYTITGISQLLSVPYALHAKTAENTFSGDYNDLSNAPNLSNYDKDVNDDFDGDYNSLVNKPTLATVATTGDYNDLNNKPSIPTVPSNVSAFTNDAGYVTTDNDQQQISVSKIGDTLYLQNGGFVIIPGISAANPKYPSKTVHCTGTPTAIVDVTNPTTGKTWMDRNLGASKAATSSTDADAYGDLYQWGRGADGHQCRNSSTTSTLSSNDLPGHGDFIIGSILTGNGTNEWRIPLNFNLWQGVNGINNPCPSGYRLPTDAEFLAEKSSWSSESPIGAFSSPLKFSMAGYRYYLGDLNAVGSLGSYWSSTVLDKYNVSNFLHFGSTSVLLNYSDRSVGRSVRCIKD